MRTQRRNMAAVLACSLALSPVSADIISSVSAPGLTQVAAAKVKKPPKKGWYVTKKGNRQYYRKGALCHRTAEDWKKILLFQ